VWRAGLRVHPTVIAGVEATAAFTAYDQPVLNDNSAYTAGVYADWQAGSHFHVLDARWREPLEAIAHPKVRRLMAQEIARVEDYSPPAAMAVAETLVSATRDIVRRMDSGRLSDRHAFAGAELTRADMGDALRAYGIAMRLLGEAALRQADELDARAMQRRAA
jgi:hypothetical protein